MSFRTPATCCLALLLLYSTSAAGDRTGIRLERIGDIPQQHLRVSPRVAAAETCLVTQNGVIIWRIDGWVTGVELYKSLMDPAASCGQAYPFTIMEINMPMAFDAGTPLVVSVDVEAVDYTTEPGCPLPGVVLAISQEYELEVPSGGGVFNIWIPLDTPIVVEEPFFAGFYIANAIDPAVGAAVLSDSIPVTCASYNIWDEAIGWVDLVSNAYFDFPGRLAMVVSGIAGGTTIEPEPAAVLLVPPENAVLYGSADLWCYDTSGSNIIDYVSFEYSTGGAFSEIGRDYDGYSPLRDGVTNNESGAGFGLNWDFSALAEGTYTVRATVHDTLSRTSSRTRTVYLEPTPPIPTIISPHNGDDVCPPLDIIMTSTDENLSFVQIDRSEARSVYSVGLTPLSQFTVGDTDGDPLDGNLAINGEFGDYYSGPVSAAVAVKLWADRGIAGLIGEGDTIQTVTEELAGLFRTRANLGTRDENLFDGLQAFASSRGNTLELDIKRDPGYFEVRTWVEEQERVVILGLSGNPATFVTVDGFKDWTQADSSHLISIANPLSGTIVDLSMRDDPSYSEVYFGSSWQRVDIMISLLARFWTVSRTPEGYDFNGDDGWSYTWAPSDLMADSLYFLRAMARDDTDYRGTSTVLVRHDCSSVYTPGDYTDDGLADITDLFMLVNFISLGGPAPSGGIGRADANCDNYINVTDIVYYMNYLFGDASPPCY